MWTQLESVMKSVKAVIRNVDAFTKQLAELNMMKERAKLISQQAQKDEIAKEDAVRED